jgi:hypothetical protein
MPPLWQMRSKLFFGVRNSRPQPSPPNDSRQPTSMSAPFIINLNGGAIVSRQSKVARLEDTHRRGSRAALCSPTGNKVL